MRILFEKMMLDLPGIVIAEAVGQLDLVERILVEPQLATRFPRARQLQLIENAELHPFLLGGDDTLSRADARYMTARLRPALVTEFLPGQAAEPRALAQHLELFDDLLQPRPIDIMGRDVSPSGLGTVERMDRLLTI